MNEYGKLFGNPKSRAPLTLGTWIALGVAIGLSLGVALNSIPLGLALGLSLGVAIGASQQRQTKPNSKP